MNTLSNIAHKKNFSIVDTATISQAMDCMLKNNNGSVVILNKKFPVGIVTESMILELLQKGICFDEKIVPYAKKPVITAHCNRPVESAFELVVTNNIRRLVLVDDAGKYAGTVCQEDLFSFLEEDVYKVDLKVSDLLNHDVSIVAVSPKTTLFDALKQMSDSKIGSVIVAKEAKVVGIVTEKDILNASYKHIDLNTSVESLMSSPVVSVSIDEAITTVIALMRKKSLRRVLVTNEQGEMYALLTNRDIFKHVKGNVARMLEIKLRHAKEIMDFLPEAIIEIYDAPKQQVIHWMNRKAYEYFGSEAVEKHPEFLFHESWKKLYSTLNKEKKIINFALKINGYNFEFSGSLSKNINSNYIKLIAKDVTEHESIKQQLKNEIKEENKLRVEQEYLMMQQSKMASMGEMIGHIAHQWRQPLAQLGGIFMNLESAYAFDELDEKYLKVRLDKANEIIKYMSTTIDDFRLFFSPNRVDEKFDLVLCIQKAIQIVSAALDYYHISVHFDAKPNTYFIQGSASEFSQVILNLLNNSKDALARQTQQGRINIDISSENGMLNVLFCDNGGGIELSILPKIFKPYTSTKYKDGGTGIGLYMSQLIVEQKMNGKIIAYNTDNGACFKLTLPQRK